MAFGEHPMNQELQRVLWACYHHWQNSPVEPANRLLCYTWVVYDHEQRFGVGFHQSRLQRLEKLGFLRQGYSVRGGSRRYYTLVDPTQIGQLVQNLQLN
jgi:hypothetical protein